MNMVVILAIGLALLLGVRSFAALTAGRELNRYVDQELRTIPVLANATIYKGGFIGLSSGYARALVAGDTFAGIAYETMVGGSSNGDKSIRAFVVGDFEHTLSSASQANHGIALYASDDNTITATASGNSFVGFQVGVPAANTVVLRIQAVPAPLGGGTVSSLLTVSGGIKHKHTVKASASTLAIAVGDLGGVIEITGTTASDVQLPAVASAGAGAWATFIKNGASGALTLNPNASETIDGNATDATMDAAGDSLTIECNGTAWFIVGKNIH